MDIDPIKAANALERIYSILFSTEGKWDADKEWTSQTAAEIGVVITDIIPRPDHPDFDAVVQVGPIKVRIEDFCKVEFWPKTGSVRYTYDCREHNPVTVALNRYGPEISINGYVDLSRADIVAAVDFHPNYAHPHLLVWSDKQLDDPTHNIDLVAALDTGSGGPVDGAI